MHIGLANEKRGSIQQVNEIKDTVFLIEMTIESVRIDLKTSQRLVILKEKNEERYLFIYIAQAEAYILAFKLQGTISPRPLSHELFMNILDGLGATITLVIITKVVEDIWYARIRIKFAEKEMEFDSRTSDALIFAIYSGAPIFTEKQVIDSQGKIPNDEEESRG